MIKKYKNGHIVNVGDWVNFQSIFTSGIAGRPAQVTKIAGQRVYFVIPRKVKEDEYEEFKALKSLAYVSDTKEDADFVFNANHQQMDAIRIMTGYVEEAFKERIEAYNAK